MTTETIAHETGLVRYDRMCRAIAEAHQVDEVKDLRDKALALEAYARQAKNLDAERKACEIRLRAERRCGELLREQAASGGRATRGGDRDSNVVRDDIRNQPTLADLGITRDQSSKWQKLAGVDEDEFESALGDPNEKPTTAGILRKANGSTGQMHEGALWLWGRLRDFERDRLAENDPAFLWGELTETMQADIRRIAPSMAQLLLDLMVYANVTHK